MATDALRQALEGSLKANPDDLATHMAYADHLHEQGDPRGEFIQTQIALEDPGRSPGERDRLRQREQELLAAHQAEWLGEIAPLFLKTEAEIDQEGVDTFDVDCQYYGHHVGRECNHFRFARGWLDSLHLCVFTPRLAETLGQCPTIGLLRQLTITHSDTENDPGYGALAQWSCLGNLRRFQLGPDDDQCHISGLGIAPAIAQMTRLEELYLYAHEVEVDEVFALPLPSLRTLFVYHLHEYPLEVLAANPSLGNLVTLSCWPHGLEPGHGRAYIQPDDFRALLASPHLKSLANLALYLTDIDDRCMTALVESGLLRLLRVLDLWNGRVGDEGAHTLARCPDLRRLEKLRMSVRYMTNAGIEALKASGANVEIIGPSPYDPAGELRHLWEGDCE
jgi:uncharacterized protein (TIGR02996 family)